MVQGRWEGDEEGRKEVKRRKNQCQTRIEITKKRGEKRRGSRSAGGATLRGLNKKPTNESKTQMSNRTKDKKGGRGEKWSEGGKEKREPGGRVGLGTTGNRGR